MDTVGDISLKEVEGELQMLDDESGWVTIGVRYRKSDPIYQDILKLVSKYAIKNKRNGAATVLKVFARVFTKKMRAKGEL